MGGILMLIKTLIDGQIVSEQVILSESAVNIPNIFVTKFDDINSLVIDSFFDRVDIVPTSLLDGKNIFILNRYSQTHLASGVETVKRLYEQSLKNDVATKQQFIFSICPTYSCNMNCVYCFENDTISHMKEVSAEDLTDILELVKKEITVIRQSNSKTSIDIELFGGEPLQERNKHLVEMVLQFARENKCQSTIITNGYELLGFVTTFVKYRDVLSKVNTTLDGTETTHNMRRRLKSRKGSFEEISSGIDRLLKLGLRVGVQTNVDKENIDNLKDIFCYYESQGWTAMENFNAEIARVDDKYGSGNRCVLSETDIVKKIISIFSYEPPRWLNLAFIKSPERVSKMAGVSFNQNEYGKALYHYCWATSPIIKGCYIGTSKEMYRCTVTVPSEQFKCGELGRDEILGYEDLWLNNSCFSRNECLNCDIGGFCGGGCVIEKQTKDFNSICEYEKTNFKAFIEEVLIPRMKRMMA